MEGERQERVEVHFPVSFIGDARGDGIVRNLSSAGCKIESDVQVRDTQLLVLRLYIPDETSPVMVDVAAVRWAKPPAFGVQFLSIKELEQQRLNRYVVSLAPP